MSNTVKTVIWLSLLGLAFLAIASAVVTVIGLAIYVVGAVINSTFAVLFGVAITFQTIMLCGLAFIFFFGVTRV